MEIFKLFGSIMVDSNDAEKSIAKTGKDAETTGSKLGNMAKTAGKVGMAVGAGMVAAGTAVFGLATKTSEATDRIDKMSQQLGVSREGFQEWDYILGQNGASIDSFGAGMKTLNKAMTDVKEGAKAGTESFTALDDSILDLINSGASQEEVFAATVESFQAMPEGIEKSRLATELFGKQGMELMPMLNQTAEGTEELRQRAHELGLVMSDDAVDAGVVFGDTLDDLKGSLGAALMQGLAPMLPAITGIMNELVNILPPLMSFIAPLIEKLVPVLGTLLEKLLPVFMTLLEALMPILEPLIDTFLLLVETVLIPLIELLTPLIEAIMPVWLELFEALMPILLPLIETFMEIVKVVMPAVIAMFKDLAEKVMPILNKAFEALKPVIDGAMKFIGGIIKTILAVIQGDWEGAWNGLKESFSGVLGIIKGIANGFKTAFEGIFNAIKNKILGIWDGMVGGIQKGIDKLKAGIDKIVNLWNNAKAKVTQGLDNVGGKIQSGFNDVKNFFGLASGGTLTSRGGVLVGENGPELLELPQGASVKPLDRISGGGVTFGRGAFEGAFMMDDYGVDRIMDRITGRLRVSGARI